LSPIISIPYTVLPTLQDGWLQGLTDAEGSFSVSLLSNSVAFRYRYLLCQKWDDNKIILQHIVNLFGVGSVKPHSIPLHWEIRINGLSNCQKLFPYFAAYPLKSKKRLSYGKFVAMHTRLTNKDHLDPILREELKTLASQINTKRKTIKQ
jgi:hypothetical protein